MTKYRAVLGTDPAEINYFSSEFRDIDGHIDLSDYLITDGLSKISFSHNAIDSNNGFYLEAGEVNLKCSNVIQGWGSLGEYQSMTETALVDWLEFYNTYNTFFFKLEIWNDERESPIWTGIFRKANLSFSDRSNEILNINVISFDKEFADYYSNKALKGHDQFPRVISVILPLTNLNLTRLKDVITLSFPNVDFDFQTDSDHFINSYYVADKSYIYAPLITQLTSGSRTLTIKAGYDPFVLMELDRFTWLSDIIKGMGWKWNFNNDIISIRKRFDTTAEVTDLDFNHVLSHSLALNNLSHINTVLIEDGEYYGGNNSELSELTATNIIDDEDNYHYVGGKDAKIYSTIFDSQSNNNTPFRDLNVTLGNIYYRIFDDWNMKKKSDESLQGKVQLNQYINLDFYQPVQYQKYSADNARTIELSLTTNLSYPTSLDIAAARTSNNTFYGNGNSYSQAHDAGNNGIYMYGNPCHALLRLDANVNRFETYDVYTNTQAFRDNFGTLTGASSEMVIDLEVSGIYTDIEAMYRLINYPYADLTNYKFTISDLQIDLLKQTTQMKLNGKHYG